jgi:hypothetical protein
MSLLMFKIDSFKKEKNQVLHPSPKLNFHPEFARRTSSRLPEAIGAAHLRDQRQPGRADS